MNPYLTRVTVPTLNVAGWWDQEDFYGPVTIYRALEKHDQANRNFLVVGPWSHGGWSGGPGQKLGNIDFGSPTGEYYRQKIQAPFFAYYLKDKGTLAQPEAHGVRGGEQHVAHVRRVAAEERDDEVALLPRRTASSSFDAADGDEATRRSTAT